MRRQPTVTYNGLTIILSNPSRFDKHNPTRPRSDFLLSANGGVMFNRYLLNPDYNLLQCDVRTKDCTDPLLEKTKCICLLGEEAMKKYALGVENNSLNEMRGSLLATKFGIPAIATFNPQEAVDRSDWEHGNREEYHGTEPDEDNSEDDGKTHGITKRANYAFWMRRDLWKCKQIMAGKFLVEKEPNYRIYPPSDEVIHALNSCEGIVDFDIETDYEEQNLLCFAFNSGDTVFCAPILNSNYTFAYSTVPFIMRALARMFERCIICAHNGAGFDYIVMANKYKIAVKSAIDTMLMWNRCFPDLEKSLMHVVSYFTWQRFHKDEDSRAYKTHEHMMDKLKYCGKDVFTLRLIREAMTKYAKTIPGLEDSITCANDSIIPYVTTMIHGIRYDQKKVADRIGENDKLMEQYIRICKLLIGPELKLGEGAFPGSSRQNVKYFHDMLGYDVQFRSAKTGAPSLGKKSLYKLALKYPGNPVITFLNMYRRVQKETSALQFEPWKHNEPYTIRASLVGRAT